MKKQILFRLGVILALVGVVWGGVWYVGSKGHESPPDLSLGVEGSGLQGLLDVNFGNYKFLGFDEKNDPSRNDDDWDKWDAFKQTRSGMQPLQLSRAGGVNHLYVSENMTFEQIVQRIDPAARAVVVAYWDAKDKLWHMTDNTYYNNAALVKKYTKSQLADVTVPSGKTFVLIPLNATSVYDVKNGATAPTEGSDGAGRFEFCNADAGWHQIAFKDRAGLKTRLESCGDRVTSVWPQTSVTQDNPFKERYTLNVAFDNWVANSANNATYHIAWVELGPVVSVNATAGGSATAGGTTTTGGTSTGDPQVATPRIRNLSPVVSEANELSLHIDYSSVSSDMVWQANFTKNGNPQPLVATVVVPISDVESCNRTTQGGGSITCKDVTDIVFDSTVTRTDYDRVQVKIFSAEGEELVSSNVEEIAWNIAAPAAPAPKIFSVTPTVDSNSNLRLTLEHEGFDTSKGMTWNASVFASSPRRPISTLGNVGISTSGCLEKCTREANVTFPSGMTKTDYKVIVIKIMAAGGQEVLAESMIIDIPWNEVNETSAYFTDFTVEKTSDDKIRASWNVNQEKIDDEIGLYSWNFYANKTTNYAPQHYQKVHGAVEYSEAACGSKDMCVVSTNDLTGTFVLFRLDLVKVPSNQVMQSEVVNESLTVDSGDDSEDYISNFAVNQNGSDVIVSWDQDLNAMMNDDRLFIQSGSTWNYETVNEMWNGSVWITYGSSRVTNNCDAWSCFKVNFPSESSPDQFTKFRIRLTNKAKTQTYEQHEVNFNYVTTGFYDRGISNNLGIINPNIFIIPNGLLNTNDLLNPLSLEVAEFTDTGFKFEVAGGRDDIPVSLNTLTVNDVNYKPTTQCEFRNTKLVCNNTGLQGGYGNEYKLAINVSFGDLMYNLNGEISGIVNAKWHYNRNPQMIEFGVAGIAPSEFILKRIKVGGNSWINNPVMKDCDPGILNPYVFCRDINTTIVSANVQLRVVLEIEGKEREFVVNPQST